jgi:tRNA(Ile2) C34 agmatinyltransferase TiaS
MIGKFPIYTFPIQSPALRRFCVRESERCPDCGGDLDTGWECNDCRKDWRDIAYTPIERDRDKRL